MFVVLVGFRGKPYKPETLAPIPREPQASSNLPKHGFLVKSPLRLFMSAA